MDFAQRLVSLAYQSLGYFVMEGVTAGVREADLLAIKLDESGSVSERLHVEVSVSVNPSGVLRAQAAYGDSESHPARSAGEYIEKKFYHGKLVREITSRLGPTCRQVFVHGKLKKPEQLDTFDQQQIEHRTIGQLVSDALQNGEPVAELKRQVTIADLLSIKEP